MRGVTGAMVERFNKVVGEVGTAMVLGQQAAANDESDHAYWALDLPFSISVRGAMKAHAEGVLRQIFER